MHDVVWIFSQKAKKRLGDSAGRSRGPEILNIELATQLTFNAYFLQKRDNRKMHDFIHGRWILSCGM